MATISAIVITKNEERQIADCLAALRWADELVVLDSFSTDRTVEVCRQFTNQVHQREFVSFPIQRNAALQIASGDWAFFVDADERVSPELDQKYEQQPMPQVPMLATGCLGKT